MKKRSCFILLLLLCSLVSGRVSAFPWPDFTPLIPVAPQFCVMCIPANIQTYYSYADQVKQMKNELEKVTNVTEIKQIATSYATNLGSSALGNFKSKTKTSEPKVMEYSMTIEECKKQNIDINDEKSVQKGFVSLFLEYPADDKEVRFAYQKKGNQLKIDTAIEAYITSLELAKKLYGQTANTAQAEEAEDKKAETATVEDFSELGLITQFKYVEECLTTGNQKDESGASKISEACRKVGIKDCTGSGTTEEEKEQEDRMCLWKNAVLGVRLYEKFMIYNEYIMSMLAQYEAVNGINDVASIRLPGDAEVGVPDTEPQSEQQQSSIDIDIKGGSTINNVIEVGANHLFASQEPSERYKNIFSEYNKKLQSNEEKLPKGAVKLGGVEGYVSPAAGKEDDFAALEAINRAQDNLNKAMLMHNSKQNLPQYRKVFQMYDNLNRYHTHILNNLLLSGMCVENYLSTYYENSSSAWYGDNCAHTELGALYCHYKPERLHSSTLPSKGKYDMPCPDNGKYKCYIRDINDIVFDKGLVGYLTALHQTIKDNQASTDVQAYIEMSEDTTENEDNSATSDEDDSNYVETRDSVDNNVLTLDVMKANSTADNTMAATAVKDNETAEEEQRENRKNALLNWAIGAEVARDMAQDLLSSDPKFGEVKQKFPLWYDQKEYYNQYIDGKYANIKDFIKNEPLSDKLIGFSSALNEIYPYKDEITTLGQIGKTAEQQRKETQQSLTNFQNYLTGFSGSRKAIEEKFAELEQKRVAAQNSHKTLLNNKKAEIKALYAELATVNTSLSELNKEYNANVEMVETSEATGPEAQEGLEYGDKLYNGRTVDIKLSPQYKDKDLGFEKNKTIQDEIGQRARAALNADEKNTVIKTLETRAVALKKQIENLESSIDKARGDYVRQISDMEEQNKVEIKNLLVQKVAEEELQKVVAGLTEKHEPIALINNVMNCVRQALIAQVDDALSQLHAMGASEELYYAAYKDKVQQIHNDLIEKINSLSIADLSFDSCPVLVTLNQLGLGEALSDILNKVVTMFADICKNNYCTNPDEQYFVGIIGKARDFKSPKVPLDFSSAPLREVFHFDIADYGNVDKCVVNDNKCDGNDLSSNKNIIITKESFLESGIDMPEVWKQILSPHAYVEKDIDLKTLFDNSNATAEVARSGTFPCLGNDGRIIDIASQTYIFASNKKYKLPYCVTVSTGRNRNGKYYANEITAGVGNDIENTQELWVYKGSELGQILSYIPDARELLSAEMMAKLPGKSFDSSQIKYRLTFNDALQNAMYIINKTEDFGSNKQEDFKFKLSERRFFSKNQFGDFLDQKEQESKVAESMADLSGQIGDIRKDLTSIFASANYAIDNNFNLLIEEDYNHAAQLLDEQKQKYIENAKANLSGVKGTTELAAKKLAKVEHMIEVLEFDKDEVVNVYGEEDLDELEESIKTKKADEAIEKEYDDAGAEDMERQIRRIEPPYCAVYLSDSKPNQTISKNKVSTDDTSLDVKALQVEESLEIQTRSK